MFFVPVPLMAVLHKRFGPQGCRRLAWALLAIAAMATAAPAGVPGASKSDAASETVRILGLHSLSSLSKTERIAAWQEYVVAFRSATAAGNEARARELSERATSLWPERSRAWLHLAATRLRLEQWGPAIEAARQADKARPDSDPPAPLPEESQGAAGYWEGLALYKTQRLDEALPRLHASHAAMPLWAEAARALGEAEFVATHPTEAAAAYGAAFDIDPTCGKPQDLAYWAEARVASGDLEGGIASMQEALRRGPFEPGMHAKLGDLLRREERPVDAYYEFVHELLLQGVRSRFSPAALEMSQQIVQSARTLKADDPTRAELEAVSSGLRHLDGGETHQALHHLSLALALTRSASPVPRLLFADALRRDGQSEKARAELQRLLAADPNLVPALQALSEVETKLGHPHEAEAALARARTLFPTYWKLDPKLAGS